MKNRFSVQRKLIGLLDELIELPIDVMRRVVEGNYGFPQKLAVPVYDTRTRKWSYDLRFLCQDPEQAYQEAIRRLPETP